MSISDEDKQKEIEKANSYKQMFALWAWQDFASTLAKIREDTVKEFLYMDWKESAQFKAGQCKGILECLNKIQAELDYIVREQ